MTRIEELEQEKKLLQEIVELYTKYTELKEKVEVKRVEYIPYYPTNPWWIPTYPYTTYGTVVLSGTVQSTYIGDAK